MSYSEWLSRRIDSIEKIVDRRRRGDAGHYIAQIKQLANIVPGKGDASSFTAYSGSVAYSAGTAANPVVLAGEYGSLRFLSDYLETRHYLLYPDLGPAADFTVECFFKQSWATSRQNIWSFGDDDHDFYLDIRIDSGQLEVVGYDDDSQDEIDYVVSPISRNTWYYIALSRIDTTWYITFNGVTTEFADTTVIDLSNTNLVVGAEYSGSTGLSSRNFMGMITNFRYTIGAIYPVSSPTATNQLFLRAQQSSPFADSSDNNLIAQGTCTWSPDAPLSI
jgi:hypothetical protein